MVQESINIGIHWKIKRKESKITGVKTNSIEKNVNEEIKSQEKGFIISNQE